MMQTSPADVENFRPLTELIPSHWQTSAVESSDGLRIHYTRTGGIDKPALILLHGVQINGLTWLRTALALESTCDVIMPDQRGHGKTGLNENGLSSEMMVNDLITLIKTLKLENPMVIGHSMGAEIAGRLAAAYPLRVVVMVDPGMVNIAKLLPPMPEGELPPYMQPIVEAAKSLKSLPHKERMVAGLRMFPMGSPVHDEADYVTFVEAQGEFDWSTYRYLMSLGCLFEHPDVIAKITCPALLLTARPMMPNVDIQPGVAAYTNNWPHGQHIHFADSGHFIMADQFEKFISTTREFLAKH